MHRADLIAKFDGLTAGDNGITGAQVVGKAG